jgi:predicted heme/steroid binding protein/uncharacterized membrane protein
MKQYTRKELEKYNGKDGQPAYIAVEGKVYDVSESNRWNGGKHMNRHHAGKDLTEALANAPHDSKLLEKVTYIGILKEKIHIENKVQPALISWILNFHPHPITVHFPQAFFAFSPIFLILFYIFKIPHFERTCFYLSICGIIMSIPAFFSGIFHWIYKYGKSIRPVFKFKLIMSLVLLCYTGIIVFLHASKGTLPKANVDIILLIMYLIQLPIIISIGHAGGIIVFGSSK